jgi:beta-lactamase superfamily II metal-dependent hydrolase
MAKKKSVVKQTAPAKKTAISRETAVTKKVKAPVKKGAAAAASPSLPGVRVQMFRQGLGDSFLVTFDDQGPNERRMLIDCGSLGNKVSEINTGAIGDYLQTLIDGGKKIDVLIATHEHQDHVSGFRTDLQPVLKGNVDQVWLAWTENPADPDARRLAKCKEDLGAGLQKMAQVAPAAAVGMNISSLLGFAGDTLLGATFATTVNDAMEFVRSGTGGKTTYHNPGDLIEDNLFPGFRIYVLGPPRTDASLKDVGSHESSELYGLAAALTRAAAFHVSAASAGSADDPELPFDQRYNQSGKQALAEQYPEYSSPENDWRRIDYDWLNGASELALQLDNLTNNTSLALAIERIADGKVLLFPADAQEGNWLSWHEPAIKWTVTDPSGATRDVTAADLLSKTVFYKVGHHGSHNATAKGKGLELMTQQEELVAFIPVDRAMALTRSPKDSWQMPARPLYRELLKHCQGRVARADLGWAGPAVEGDVVEAMFVGMEDANRWAEWDRNQQAASHVNVTNPLFIEYVLE